MKKTCLQCYQPGLADPKHISSSDLNFSYLENNSYTTTKALVRLLSCIAGAVLSLLMAYEPRCDKTGLRGFRPGPTQTGLCSHGRWLGA